ncbi:MAG TPA: flagellar biosynthesis protein FliQ [Gammaproteobacteria bacterium]|nr:flagellar biosynthesis protein FliQ [Gammaproteobacteria bacterium]
MTPDTVLTVGQQALQITIMLAGPLLLAALIVGLIVGMFQAATQINEMTLTFIPKLAAVAAVLLLGGHWMLSTLVTFTVQLFHNIPNMIG